jgi:PAS domain S-box-containing protein
MRAQISTAAAADDALAAELRDCQARLEDLQRIAGVGYWDWEVDEDRVHCTAQVNRIFGFAETMGPVAAGAYLAMIHPDELPLAEAVLAEARAGAGRWRVEMRVKDPLHGERWVEVIACIGELGLSAPRRLSGTVRDVTAERLAEARLAHLSRLHVALSSINEAIVRRPGRPRLLEEACRLAVESGLFVAAAIAVPRAGGLTFRTVACATSTPAGGTAGASGWDWAACLEAGHAARANAAFGEVCNDVAAAGFGPEITARARALGGRSMACFSLRDGDRCLGVLSVCAREVGFFQEPETNLLRRLVEDIVYALVAIENEVKGERDQQAVRELSQAVAQTADLVMLTDREGRIEYVNPAFEAATGYVLAEVLGQTPRAIKSQVHPPELFAELWATLLTGKVFRGVFVNRRRDGEHFYEEKTISPIRDSDGEVRHFVSTGRDITARIRDEQSRQALQEAVRRAETLAALGNLVAGVAHEVRNPIFAMSSTLEALALDLGGDERFRPHFRVLAEQMERLERLMKELLDYGKPVREERREASLRQVVAAGVALCAAKAAQLEVTVENRVAAGLPRLLVDADRLSLVFRNLVDNAIDHAGEGGLVEVTSGAAGRDENEGLVILVADSGPGFADADLARLFEPFFTRRAGGTGLGLSLARRIVEEHGGLLRAGNRPGGGAEVEVWLPPPEAT